jgi:hypothetical protein
MAEKSYAQLYIHDPDEALEIHSHRNPQCQHQVMAELQDMLHNVNPFVPIYKQAYQIMSSKPPEEQHDVTLRLHLNDSADGRRYNLPTANEIAAIVPGHGEEVVSSDRDIILRLIGGSLKRMYDSALTEIQSGYSYPRQFMSNVDNRRRIQATTRSASPTQTPSLRDDSDSGYEESQVVPGDGSQKESSLANTMGPSASRWYVKS